MAFNFGFPDIFIATFVVLRSLQFWGKTSHFFMEISLGKAQLYYRAAQVVEADVVEGKIPARGYSDVNARLVVEGSSVTKELTDLAEDLVSGEIGLDTKTRLDGKVTILGFVRRKAVATSDCHMVVAVSKMKVKSQQCTDKTKL